MTDTPFVADSPPPAPAKEIFPDAANASWGYVNYAEMARQLYPATRGPNKLLDPREFGRFSDLLAGDQGVDCLFGGYEEDRGHLWRTSYLKPGCAWHRGIDYTLPAGVIVCAPTACEVIHVVRDGDQQGGWGGALYCKLERPYKGAEYFVYGHLRHKHLPVVGDFFGFGEDMALLGKADENGGWFPHLHVQCFTEETRRAYTPKLERMDGYGIRTPGFRQLFPDPADLMAGRHHLVALS